MCRLPPTLASSDNWWACFVHLCALALPAMHLESLIRDPVQMHLITSEHDLWRKSLRDCPFPEPWWAFLWPGGFAITKWCSENPHRLAGLRPLPRA